MSKLGDIAMASMSLGWLSGRDLSVMNHIADCQTGRIGYNELFCECGNHETHYNSCRDRHCPLCQGAARARWVNDRLNELLPCPYFHVVFTVPHELVCLALANRRLFYRVLFECVHETLLAVCGNPENLGGRVGGMSILHTWNQKLGFHPHIHCIIPGGGISPDGKDWIAGNPNYLVSVKRLSAVFRGKFLGCLEKLCDEKLLEGDESKHRIALRKASCKNFVVYAKQPFGGPAQVVKYLGKYTHRVGISEQRIISFENQKVKFSWIDRGRGHVRMSMSLSLDDFVRKFLLHIMPKGLRKIRYFGYMGNRDRSASIAQVRSLVAKACPETKQADPGVDTQIQKTPESTWLKCPKCGKEMHVGHSIAVSPEPGWLKNRLALIREIHGPDPNLGVTA